MMSVVKDVNTKCPMITLRIEPNKYPNENEIWYSNDCGYHCECPQLANSDALVNRLNFWFGTDFVGELPTILRFIKYPLPKLNKFGVYGERS